jgi:hypothetical protein
MTDDRPPGIRRVCIAVDIEPRQYQGYSPRRLEFLRRHLAAAIAETCRESGLDRVLVNQQSAGDVEIILLPAGIDEPRAVAALVNGLCQVIRRINEPLPEGARVRIGMAVHEGITVLAATGFVGRAVSKTRRMLGSEPLRSAFARSPRSDLAVMLSDQVFEEIESFGRCLPAEEFERVEIDNPATRSRDIGWIFLPE